MQAAQAADLQDIQKQKEQNQAELLLHPVSSVAPFTPCTDKPRLVPELHLQQSPSDSGWKRSGEVRGAAGGTLHCHKQLRSSAAAREEPGPLQVRGCQSRTPGPHPDLRVFLVLLAPASDQAPPKQSHRQQALPPAPGGSQRGRSRGSGQQGAVLTEAAPWALQQDESELELTRLSLLTRHTALGTRRGHPCLQASMAFWSRATNKRIIPAKFKANLCT